MRKHAAAGRRAPDQQIRAFAQLRSGFEPRRCCPVFPAAPDCFPLVREFSVSFSTPSQEIWTASVRVSGTSAGSESTRCRSSALATRARVSIRLRAPPPSSSREITDWVVPIRSARALGKAGLGPQVVDQLTKVEVLLDPGPRLRRRGGLSVLDVFPSGVVRHRRSPLLGEPPRIPRRPCGLEPPPPARCCILAKRRQQDDPTVLGEPVGDPTSRRAEREPQLEQPVTETPRQGHPSL